MNFNNELINKIYFNGELIKKGFFNGLKIYEDSPITPEIILGDWYDYKNNANIEGDLIGENVEVYMYNYAGYTGASGLARDITVKGKAKIDVLLNCLTYPGAPINYQVMFYKGETLYSTHPYQFDSQGSAMLIDIQEELTQGDYTIVIGNNTGAGFEFNIQGSSIMLDEIIPVKFIPTHKNSMWCWNNDDINKTEDLIRVCERVNADCVYQSYTNNLNSAFNTYVRTLNEQNLDVWLVFGDANWYDKPELVKGYVDRAKTYNDSFNYDVKGVVFDIEPHLANDDLEVQERINIFTQTAKEVYLYAKEIGVNIMWCIPHWFNLNQLAYVVKYGDGITIMNYTKEYKIERFDLEGRLCVDKNQFVEDISEFQKPGQWGLTEAETFYNQGLDGSLPYWEAIREHINDYENFSTSYHYFDVCLELLNKETQENLFKISDWYDIGYTKTQDGVTYTVVDDEKVNIATSGVTTTVRMIFFGSWNGKDVYINLDENKKYKIGFLGTDNNNVRLLGKMLETNDTLLSINLKATENYYQIVSGVKGVNYLSIDVVKDAISNNDFTIVIEEVKE